MPDTKISGLSTLPIVATNELFINDAGSSKKATIAQIVTYLQQSAGLPRVKRAAIHSISSTTGTEVVDLRLALEAGTYTFDYYLIVRSATTSVGPMVGINFTGTAAVKSMLAFWGDATIAVTGEVHSMDDEGVKGFGFISGLASKTYTTTAPNLGTTVGVSGTAVNIPVRITGVLVVTVAGDLALWHSSETNTATSVEAGSSLRCIRVN